MPAQWEGTLWWNISKPRGSQHHYVNTLIRWETMNRKMRKWTCACICVCLRIWSCITYYNPGLCIFSGRNYFIKQTQKVNWGMLSPTQIKLALTRRHSIFCLPCISLICKDTSTVCQAATVLVESERKRQKVVIGCLDWFTEENQEVSVNITEQCLHHLLE